MFGQCFECSDDWTDYLVAIGGAGGMVMLWIAMNALTATNFDAIDITLQFLQILALVHVDYQCFFLCDATSVIENRIVQNFHTPWHRYVQEVQQAISVVNFDLGYELGYELWPKCLYRVMAYVLISSYGLYSSI